MIIIDEGKAALFSALVFSPILSSVCLFCCQCVCVCVCACACVVCVCARERERERELCVCYHPTTVFRECLILRSKRKFHHTTSQPSLQKENWIIHPSVRSESLTAVNDGSQHCRADVGRW